MTGPEASSQEGRVKLHAIGQAYADVAQVESAIPMQLLPFLFPTVALPAKPPPAIAGFMPGVVGGRSGSVALNFSNVGLTNVSSRSRLIVKVRAVTIINDTGGSLDYDIRRDDLPIQTGHTFNAWAPAYSDGGYDTGTALGMVRANNNVAAPGLNIAQINVQANRSETYPFAAIINNGAFFITSNIVNQEVRALWWFDTYPVLRPQPSG